MAAARVELTSIHVPASNITLAQQHYNQAAALEQAGRAECVDHYYHAATLAWPEVEGMRPAAKPSPAWQLYHSAITRLLSTAQQHGRWRPGVGLLLAGSDGLVPLATSFQGFAWQPHDFQQLVPVGSDDVPGLNHQFRAAGLGVPLVVVRRSPPALPFMQPTQSFAATAVVRPEATCDQPLARGTHQPARFVLELVNPVTTDTLTTWAGTTPLARDLSAPFAYPPRDNDRDWLRNFLVPGGSTNDEGLFMIEPYQPGKIPLVLVHGLLSDPLTWTNMVNELRTNRELAERYQIWGFRYSTGTQFFQSAALLRRQLREIRAIYDPHRSDPALSQMVLVGHSMGGLLAKLQVTSSGELLWHTLANRPPSQIVASPDVRHRLTEQMIFTPNPDITRVIFIGTPHQGSDDASRCIGRLGAALVETPPEIERQHAQLIRDNPGVFHPKFERQIPRSIDLLEPNHPFLIATQRLPFGPGVHLHSICGVVDDPFSLEPTDGVVPLGSARLIGVRSEHLVPARHTELTSAPTAITEVARILALHGAGILCQ